MSYLEVPEKSREILIGAGFGVEAWNDKTELARKAFEHMVEPQGDPDLPQLGIHLLVGHDILTKACNLHRNLEERRVTLIETRVSKPQ